MAPQLGVRVVMLPAFGKGDLVGDKAGIARTVEVLKQLAPQAEKAGVVLGLENYLSAADNVDIIRRIASPAVQVWYDVCNSNDKGYDIYREIRWPAQANLRLSHEGERRVARPRQGGFQEGAGRRGRYRLCRLDADRSRRAQRHADAGGLPSESEILARNLRLKGRNLSTTFLIPELTS